MSDSAVVTAEYSLQFPAGPASQSVKLTFILFPPGQGFSLKLATGTTAAWNLLRPFNQTVSCDEEKSLQQKKKEEKTNYNDFAVQSWLPGADNTIV
ncbi:hypothetical protein BaRGS_00016497 [Batillaria attramentaria]|uniref:Uncharacterized protein n=1 Tax=Batillaria attramentaria TaxID=370345 RepID=A0ABD0KYH6_9CAEN